VSVQLRRALAAPGGPSLQRAASVEATQFFFGNFQMAWSLCRLGGGGAAARLDGAGQCASSNSGAAPLRAVSLVNGLALGGGAALAAHAGATVVTERAAWGMPEGRLGFFVDAGVGTLVLPRLPGRTGEWLALTGARLGCRDLVRLGIATHAVAAAAVPALAARLATGDNAARALAEAQTDAPAPELEVPFAPTTPLPPPDELDAAFSARTVEDVRTRLGAAAEAGRAWAAEALKALEASSPVSARVNLTLVRLSRDRWAGGIVRPWDRPIGAPPDTRLAAPWRTPMGAADVARSALALDWRLTAAHVVLDGRGELRSDLLEGVDSTFGRRPPRWRLGWGAKDAGAADAAAVALVAEAEGDPPPWLPLPPMLFPDAGGGGARL